QLTITVVSPLSITTASLPGGVVQRAYANALAATGGTTPYTWSISAGALPGGIALDAASGQLTGTPADPGTYNFTVHVVDSTNPVLSTSRALSIIVTEPLAITTVGLPVGSVTSMYNQSLTAAGGTAPYTWSITAGSLPPGMSLSTAGALTGSPTTSGMFGLTI